MKGKGFITAIMAAAVLLSSGLVQAQTGKAAPGPGQGQGEGPSTAPPKDRLSEELNLTPDQRARVQAVFEQMRTNLETALDQARTNADAQLKKILTPEQYQKFQNLGAEHEHHPHGGGDGGSDTGHE